ncbi:MAG: hypothetical protein JWO03_3870 [Bacteroidetes bacterium]|nr:hypothetical protein [Bacteroidota bacterium]
MRKVYNLILLLFLISSCSNKQQQEQFARDSYPLKVGNWWRYQVVNFFGSQSTDTISLNVVSLVTSGSTTDYTCHLLKNGLVIDSGHFVQSDTALYYSGSNPYYSIFGFFNLKFPFVEGQKWAGTFPGDTIIAAGKAESFKVLGSTYAPVYSLARRFSIPQNNLIQIIYLTPKVGVIYQSINFRSDTAVWVQEAIHLIDYNLK